MPRTDTTAALVDELARQAWAPSLERFSRSDLEQLWPRVLTVESAIFASGAHKTKT